MKAYRELSKCFIAVQKFEVRHNTFPSSLPHAYLKQIAFGYAAKFLHLSWCCDSQSNELAAYDLLGKIFYYLGNSKKSCYYHSRMAMNIREPTTSSLRCMQIDNHHTLQKVSCERRWTGGWPNLLRLCMQARLSLQHRYEIFATRELKKKRRKQESKGELSLNDVSSDEENNLNLLIPEENKDFEAG